MNLYEKQVAQMEAKVAKHKYRITRHPLNEKAEKLLGVYEYDARAKKDVNYAKFQSFLERNKKDNKSIYEYIFFYDDPQETEAIREEIAVREAIDSFSRFSTKMVPYVDYNITVSKVVVIE